MGITKNFNQLLEFKDYFNDNILKAGKKILIIYF